MPTVLRDVSVPHERAQMFELVSDVERYPEFLPWCNAAKILTREDNELTATLLLSRAGVQSRFSTRNRSIEDRQIDIELLDGPFDHLRGRWKFEALEARTRVSLELRYQFSNPMFGFLFSGAVEDVASDLIKAFKRRADDVYV
ncbi:MAG: type II toxin-antitoxin system RatA family toxin [Gammaproteobacteria bacterium]